MRDRGLDVWVTRRDRRCPVELARALVGRDPRLGLRGKPRIARGLDPEADRSYGYVYARVTDREGGEPFEIRAYLAGISLIFPASWSEPFARVRDVIARLEAVLGPFGDVRVNGHKVAR